MPGSDARAARDRFLGRGFHFAAHALVISVAGQLDIVRH